MQHGFLQQVVCKVKDYAYLLYMLERWFLRVPIRSLFVRELYI